MSGWSKSGSSTAGKRKNVLCSGRTSKNCISQKWGVDSFGGRADHWCTGLSGI